MLSFLYSMLMRQAMVSAMAVGFDPYMGLYHQPKYGRPALALDLAEEFRPLIADSAALTLFNNAELKEKDFIRRGGAVSLTQDGRKAVIGRLRAQDGYTDNAPSVQVLHQLSPDHGGAGAAAGPPPAGGAEEIPRFYDEVTGAQQIHRGL